MSKLAQGTQIYVIDPATNTIMEVECAISFNPGGAPADQLEDTCLADAEASYKRGLRRPGQATIGLRPDPTVASHVRLHELSEDDTNDVLEWVVGWSDGVDIPPSSVHVDSQGVGTFVLPAARTWFSFRGYISDFPFDHELNTLVSSTVTIQRSGGSTWTPKSA